MATTPLITLTATLDAVTGIAAGTVPNPCRLRVDLCNQGPEIPRIAGTALIAQVELEELSTNGDFSFPLWANDQIDPASTYYAIAAIDGKGRVVQSSMYIFNAAGAPSTIDLSDAVPITPPNYQPPPASQTDFYFVMGAGGGNTITLPVMPKAGSLIELYDNGNLLYPGVHYTRADPVINLTFTAYPGDKFYAVYYVGP